MIHTSLPRATHTVAMSQIANLNRQLIDHRATPITAAQLRLDESKVLPYGDTGLPATAVLHRLCWDGPPEFPSIHGHFTDGTRHGSLVVDLPIKGLKEIRRRLAA